MYTIDGTTLKVLVVFVPVFIFLDRNHYERQLLYIFVLQFEKGVEVTQVVEDITKITKGPMYGGDVTTVLDLMNDVISQVGKENITMNVISTVNEVRYILYILTSEN